MADFQAIAMRRNLARAERSLADDHDRTAELAVEPVQRTFHERAAESCRARAAAYENRAERDEALYAVEACR